MKIEDVEEAIRAERGVPGEQRGPLLPPCSIMGIGEAPGKMEMRDGRPFVGQAGQLLDGLLTSSGIRNIYLTNACKTQPPYKDRKQSAPTPEMLKRWRPFVDAEIKAFRPKTILLFGKIAAKLVVPGAFSMKDVVGRRFAYFPEWMGSTPEASGILCLVLYHPAMFLHGAGERGNEYRINQWKRAVSGLAAAEPPDYPIQEVVCNIGHVFRVCYDY